MKVCLVSSSYPRHASDGIASFIKGMAQAVVGLGHQVHVVAPHDPEVAPMDQGGVHVHRFHYPPWSDRYMVGHGRAKVADMRLTRLAPFLMPGFVTSGVLRTLALHRQEQFDIVHAQFLIPGGFMAGAATHIAGLPLLITLHGSDVYFSGRNAVYGAAARYALRRAAHITAASRNLYDGVLALGADPAKVSVIPYGVDVASFGEEKGQRFRERLRIPADTPVIGALGRLVYKKGFDRLVAAMPRVLDDLPGARCVIGGDGDVGTSLEAQAHELGVQANVIFAGEVAWQDVPSFHAMCDVVAVPSVVDSLGNVDGLPNVVLEAMASGRAVVASRLGGIPDAIVDGESGLLVPPGDPVNLARALIELLANARQRVRLGENAQRAMRDTYSWETIGSRFVHLYSEAIAGRASARRCPKQ